MLNRPGFDRSNVLLKSKDNCKMAPNLSKIAIIASVCKIVEKWPLLFAGMLVSRYDKALSLPLFLIISRNNSSKLHLKPKLSWLVLTKLKNTGPWSNFEAHTHVLLYTPLFQLALVRWTSLQTSYDRSRWHVMISTQTTSPSCHEDFPFPSIPCINDPTIFCREFTCDPFFLRNFQHTPGTYQAPNQQFMIRTPFLLGVRGDVWGMLHGHVGVLLDV